MSWELTVSPQINGGAGSVGSSSPVVVTQAQAGSIQDGFRWQLKPNGGAVQLEFNGRNDRLRITPRGAVRLKVDGQPAFFGIAVDPPSLNSRDAEKIVVVGGREVLRKTLSDGKVYLGTPGIFTIVRDLLSRLCPSPLVYDPTLIGDGSGTDTGPTLSTFYKPFQGLDEVFDTLAQSAGVTWDVDNQGRVFFGRLAAPATVVGYSTQPWQRLQVQGREVVTKAVLRILTAPALPDGAYVQYQDGVPGQVVASVSTTAHNIYRAEEAFSVPAGVSVISTLAPTGPHFRNNVNAAPAIDTDASTFVTLGIAYNTTGSSGDNIDNLALLSPAGRVVGVEFDYSLTVDKDTPEGSFAARFSNNGSTTGFKLATAASVTTMRVLLPPKIAAGLSWVADAQFGPTYAVSTNAPSAQLRVYGVRFLLVDDVAAQRLAGSFLKLPFATPAQVTLPYLAPPSQTLTVTGSPDGNVSGDTGLWEYEHSTETVRTTRISLGATGQSETARAIRFTAEAAARRRAP